MTIKEKIMKIMSLALEINPPEIKDIGKKKTAVFVNWLPHCNYLEIRVYLNGWDCHKDYDEYFDVFLHRKDADDKLDEIIKRLEEINESEGKA